MQLFFLNSSIRYIYNKYITGTLEDSPILPSDVYLENSLIGDEAGQWTIQVIYPDGYIPLPETETDVTLTNTETSTTVAVEELDKKVANFLAPEGHTCSTCNKVYKARRNLVRHINLECGKEPQHRCPYCDYKTFRRNERKKHIERKHNIRVKD